MTDRDWKLRGSCREVDAHIFFPEGGLTAAPAKRVCLGCPVRSECLSYAVDNREFGVWGGTTTDQRNAILLARGQKIIREPRPDTVDRKEERDQKIMQLTAEGMSARCIAEQLKCTARTVTRVRTAAREAALRDELEAVA